MKKNILTLIFSVLFLLSMGSCFATSSQDETIPFENVPHSYRGIPSSQGEIAPLDTVMPSHDTYWDRTVPLNNNTDLTYSYRSHRNISREIKKLLKFEKEKGIALCDSYIKKYPKEPAFYVYKAELLVEDLLHHDIAKNIPKAQRDSMYKSSIVELKKAYAIDPGYVKALDSISECYYYLEDYQTAYKYAIKARKIKPTGVNQGMKCWSEYKIKNPDKPLPKRLYCPESI